MQNLRQSLSTFTYVCIQTHTHTQTCIHKIQQFYPVYILYIYIQIDYILMFMHIYLSKAKVYIDHGFRLLNEQVRVQLR